MREEAWQAYLDCVGELLASPQVQAMRDIRHHPGVSCYEHSVFVSYTAFRLAGKWGGDRRAAARGGLLHDLYLYDPKSLPSYRQCFAHPIAALRNATALCGGLEPAEADAIRGPHVAHGPPHAPLPGGGRGVPGRQTVRHSGGAGLLAERPAAADGPGHASGGGAHSVKKRSKFPRKLWKDTKREK